MKTLLTTTLFLLALSSCKKCYDCRIVRTSPLVPGVQFQSSTSYVEFCGTNKEFASFKDDMENSGVVQIGNSTYYHKNVVDCH